MNKDELKQMLSKSLKEFENATTQNVPYDGKVTQDQIFELTRAIHKLFSDFKDAITE